MDDAETFAAADPAALELAMASAGPLISPNPRAEAARPKRGCHRHRDHASGCKDCDRSFVDAVRWVLEHPDQLTRQKTPEPTSGTPIVAHRLAYSGPDRAWIVERVTTEIVFRDPDYETADRWMCAQRVSDVGSDRPATTNVRSGSMEMEGRS